MDIGPTSFSLRRGEAEEQIKRGFRVKGRGELYY